MVAGLCSLGLAGCSTTQTGGLDAPATSMSPEQTAMAWFRAINSKDAAAARAYFVPKQMWMMGWMKGDAQVSTFSDIRCRTTAQASTNAAVNCTFNESQSSMMGNPDSFWNIAMVRGPEGTWLIDNYGQG